MINYAHQIDEADIKAVNEALRGNSLTRGPWVERFEAALAEKCQMPHAVAFSSATAALHALMEMLLKPGDKVATSPYTFAATANSVLYAGGRVGFVDIDPRSLNIDPTQLVDIEDFKAVIAVDFAGLPCDYYSLKAAKEHYGFKLIQDAAHSLGSLYGGKPVGAFADYAILSFHPVKSITTGEGGAVLLRDESEAKWLRQFRSHGISRDGCKPGFYRQEFLGYNYNITDIQCALGLSQLEKLDRFVARRTALAELYSELLPKELGGVPSLINDSSIGKSSWHLYPFLLNERFNRDEILVRLHERGVAANVHYIPVYLHPYYQELGYPAGLCPEAEKAYAREISLPLHVNMNERDVKQVVRTLEEVVG